MSAPEKTFVIVNPAAGGGRARRRAPSALAALRDDGTSLEVRETTRPGEAASLARFALEQGYTDVVAAGGDGTTFEVLNGLMPAATEVNVTLGLLPLGTGNSFLRDFHIKSEADALGALRRRNARPVDVVHATHGDGEFYYINLLSIGFVAHVGQIANDRFKGYGALGYGLATLSGLRALRPQTTPIKLNDGSWDTRPSTFLTFSNSRFTGGTMMMAPKADTGDGLLDVIRAHAMSRRQLLHTFPKIFRGAHVETKLAEASQARRVGLEAERQPVMVDGEIRDVALRALEVRPGAIRVFV